MTTGGSDGTAKPWTTATLQQLGTAFQSDHPSQLGRAREWARYVPHHAYARVCG